MSSQWQTNFISLLPFAPLFPISQNFFCHSNWPTLESYNHLASLKKITSKSKKSIVFIEQMTKSQNFSDQYEPRIYIKGEIQTRKSNWHDFFNAMVWLTFPKTKAVLNELQYVGLKERLGKSKIRTPLENVLTLFDENGAIVVSSSPELLELLKKFQWQELFWNRREAVISQMRFFILGHSLYEKLLNPYLGITASSITFLVLENFLNKHLSEQIDPLDLLLADFFANTKIKSAQEFMPLPLLGIPDWDKANNSADYYQNTAYFRPKKLAVKE